MYDYCMVIGLDYPPPRKFLNPYPRKFLKPPSPENFSTHPPQKNFSTPQKCTLFLESNLINTTSPHFQLPFIDIYNSLLLLSFYWNTAHKTVCNTANVFLKKFFQLNHIINLLQVIFKCIVNYIIYGGCITAKTLRILCAVSRHVTI